MKINLMTYQYNTPIHKENSGYNNLSSKMNFKKAVPKNVFSNAYEVLTKGIAKGADALGSQKCIQSFIDLLKDKNYHQHIPAALSTFISGSYVYNTAKSKKIEKEQKLPLMINQTLVYGVALTCSYTTDNYLNKKFDNFAEIFNIANFKNETTRDILVDMYERKEQLIDKDYEKLFRQLKNEKIQKMIIDMREKKEKIAKEDYKNLFEQLKKVRKEKEFSYLSNIQETFDIDNKVIKAMNKRLKTNPDEIAIKNILDEIGKIAKDHPDKYLEKQKIFFKKEYFNESPFLKKMFSKHGFKKALSCATKNDKKLSTLMDGLKIGKTLFIFAMINRFAAPVLITPVANYLSDKYVERKKTKSQTSK